MKLLNISLTLLVCMIASTSCEYYYYYAQKPRPVFHSECSTKTHDFMKSYTSHYVTLSEMIKKWQSTDVYYDYMRFYKDDLLVGGMNCLYRFINRTLSESTVKKFCSFPPKEDYINCVRTTVEFRFPYCFWNPQVVFVNKTASEHYNLKSDVLYVCGSGEEYRWAMYLNADTMELISDKKIDLPKYVCSLKAYANSTALHVENGNPFGSEAIYWAGSVINDQATIGRTRLFNKSRTVIHEKTLLQSPPFYARKEQKAHFVGMFEGPHYILTFFRDEIVMHEGVDTKVQSYVSRICKDDRGFTKGTKNLWISYQDARLQCKLPHTLYVFDEIQDVKKHGDKYYAIFISTIRHDQPGSVLCIYNQTQIDKAFQSKVFLTTEGIYTQKNDLPYPPQKCGSMGTSGSATRDRYDYTMYKHLKREIIPENHTFFFFLPNVYLRTFVLDFDTFKYPTLYAGASNGKIYKFYWVQKVSRRQEEFYVADIWKPIKEDDRPERLLLDDKTKYLYATYKSAVINIDTRRIQNCSAYTYADSCIYNVLCFWNVDTMKCVDENDKGTSYLSYTGLFKFVGTVNDNLGHKSPHEVGIFWKDWLKLDQIKPAQEKIELGVFRSFALDTNQVHLCGINHPVKWYHNDTLIDFSSNSNCILHPDLTTISLKYGASYSGGRYVAIDDRGINVTIIDATVYKGQNESVTWKQGYREWVSTFTTLKENLQTCYP